MTDTRVVLVITLLLLVLLAGCVPSPNPFKDTPNEGSKVAGFWSGLWQGFIAPFTFLISLFSSHVSIYEVHNNGGWYNFGFLLGLTCFFGGSHRGTQRHREKSHSSIDPHLPNAERWRGGGFYVASIVH